MISKDAVIDRLTNEFLATNIIENNLRGYFCEAMVAEAIGSSWRVVSGGWHPWDLEFGETRAAYPDRIRIQVKNSACVQTWAGTGKPSFDLKFRRQLFYFAKDNPDTPREEYGFLCELFVLCFHDELDPSKVDQGNPESWKFFLLPTVGPNCAFTEKELNYAHSRIQGGAGSTSLVRNPITLVRGIRGRRPVEPISLSQLTHERIVNSLGL